MIAKQHFPPSFLASEAAPGGQQNDRVNILVVDDIPDILLYFKSVLNRVRGVEFQLTIEANACKALDLVEQDSYDLIISDFRMKGTNGLEVLRRAYGKNPDGLRVLMTGYNEIPAGIRDIRAAHVDAYLQKPLSAHDLLLLLHDLLRRNEPALLELRHHARDLEALAEKEEANGGHSGEYRPFITPN